MFIIGRLKHVILLLVIFLMVSFFRWNGRVSLFESIVYRVTEGTVRLVETSFLPYGDVETAKKNLMEAEMKNARLMADLSSAEMEIRELKLRSGVGLYFPESSGRGLRARITGRTPISWHGEVVVDLGNADGVEEGFIALASGGLVGIVVRVNEGNSVVRLITGKGVAVSAVTGRGKAYGIVYGDGGGGLRMESVSSRADVAKQDLVFTSGMGGMYPPMLPVGEVSLVSRDERNLSPEVEVIPSADIHNLYYILLVEP